MQKILNYLKKYGPYFNNFFGGILPFYPFGIVLVIGGIIGMIIGIILVGIRILLNLF